MSANVSGFLGTERISLNDNLLNRCTLPEVLAKMRDDGITTVISQRMRGQEIPAAGGARGEERRDRGESMVSSA